MLRPFAPLRHSLLRQRTTLPLNRLAFAFRAARARPLATQPLKPPAEEETAPQTVSARLKHLMKSYGWYAVGVYLIFSVIDFGITFTAINFLGAEQVSRLVHQAKQFIATVLHREQPEHPPEEKEKRGGSESLYAMLFLAYTIHKTLLLPVRVGLTAGFTPRMVNWLRRRGWAGSDGAKRAATQMREKMKGGSKAP